MRARSGWTGTPRGTSCCAVAQTGLFGSGSVRTFFLLCWSSQTNSFPRAVPTGNTLYVLTGHIAPVTCGAWTPDGSLVLSPTRKQPNAMT